MGYSKQGRPMLLASAMVAVWAVLPQSVFGDTSTEATGVSSSGSDTTQLDEIIVTASKRAEKLREVADSVTAFSGAELNQLGAQSFQDYLGRAPGVIFQQGQPGLSNVTIRGVGTTTFSPDQGQGTTGIYLNDIPLTDPSYAVSIPDIDTFDLQRVEVLRGPQGTLFGAATLGGAVNYITTPVNLSAFDARLEAGVSGTQHSTQVGYTAKEAVNLPLIPDVFGVRITAIKRFDPGYLDNIGTGQTNANSHDDESYRLNALLQVNQKLSLSFFSFYDREQSPDASNAYPIPNALQRDTNVPEFTDFLTHINSLKLDADLDFATLTLTGSRTLKSQKSQLDFTSAFGPGSSLPESPTTSFTTSEVRLTSPSGGRFEWLVGVYHGALHEYFPESVVNGGQTLFVVNSDYVSNETSEFGELTYRFSDQWRATVGGRRYEISLRTATIEGPPAATAITAGRDVAVGFSPKATLTYEPNNNFLTYALVSKGYRTGGVNLIPPLAGFPTPATYGPDSLVNYEIGVRPAWLDHRLTLDSTLFFINWSDIQLRLGRPDGFAYAANAGGAHNLGVENALNWIATSNLQFQLNATFVQAEISRATDLGNGVVLPVGERIPGEPRWSASELTTYHWNTDYRPYVSLSAQIVSAAQNNFVGTGTPSLPIMNYSVFNLRTGFSVRQWDFSLYANNLADRRAVTAAYTGGTGPEPGANRSLYIQPRNIGLRVDWHL
jgi:iron complex outermembrane receptor protein